MRCPHCEREMEEGYFSLRSGYYSETLWSTRELPGVWRFWPSKREREKVKDAERIQYCSVVYPSRKNWQKPARRCPHCRLLLVSY